MCYLSRLKGKRCDVFTKIIIMFVPAKCLNYSVVLPFNDISQFKIDTNKTQISNLVLHVSGITFIRYTNSQKIVLTLIQIFTFSFFITDSDYPFGIFKLFFLHNWWWTIIKKKIHSPFPESVFCPVVSVSSIT